MDMITDSKIKDGLAARLAEAAPLAESEAVEMLEIGSWPVDTIEIWLAYLEGNAPAFEIACCGRRWMVETNYPPICPLCYHVAALQEDSR